MTAWSFFHRGGLVCSRCAWVLRYQAAPVIGVSVEEPRGYPLPCSRCGRAAWEYEAKDPPGGK